MEEKTSAFFCQIRKAIKGCPVIRVPGGKWSLGPNLLPFSRFICSPFALFFNDNLVIHAKLALWHSTQVTLHHHSA